MGLLFVAILARAAQFQQHVWITHCKNSELRPIAMMI